MSHNTMLKLKTTSFKQHARLLHPGSVEVRFVQDKGLSIIHFNILFLAYKFSLGQQHSGAVQKIQTDIYKITEYYGSTTNIPPW